MMHCTSVDHIVSVATGKIQLFLRCDMLSTKAFWLLLEKFGRFLVLYIFLMTNTALLFTADGNHFVVFIL